MKAYLAGVYGQKVWNLPDGTVIVTKSIPSGDLVEIFAPPPGGGGKRVVGAIVLFGTRNDVTYLYATRNGTDWVEVAFPEDLGANHSIIYPAFSRRLGRIVSLQAHTGAGVRGNAVYSIKAVELALRAAPETELEEAFVEANFRPQAVAWVPSARRYRAYGLIVPAGYSFFESKDGKTWTPFACSLSDAEEMSFADLAVHPKTSAMVAVSTNPSLQYFRDDNNGIGLQTGIRSFDGGITWGPAALPGSGLGHLGPVPMTNVQYVRNFPGANFLGCVVMNSVSAPFPMDKYIFTVWSGNIGWSFRRVGVDGRHFAGNNRPAWSPRLQRLILGGSHLKTPAVGGGGGGAPAEWYDVSFIAVSDDFGVSWSFIDVPANDWVEPIWSDELGIFVVFGEISDVVPLGYEGPAIEHHCLMSRDGLEWTPVEIPGFGVDGQTYTGARRSLAIQFDIDR